MFMDRIEELIRNIQLFLPTIREKDKIAAKKYEKELDELLELKNHEVTRYVEYNK